MTERRRRSSSAPARRQGAASTRRAGRRVARKQRRRQAMARAWRWAVAVFGAVAVGLAGVWVLTTFVLDGDRTTDDTPAIDVPDVVGDNPQPTLVIASFDETTRVGAELILLLAVHPASGDGTVLLVPPTVLAEVPGEGLLRLGETFREGQVPLLELSLANLLGLQLDGGAAISMQGWASFFTRIGGLTLDVPQQLVHVDANGQRSVRFQAGVQHLDGPRVAEYLAFRQDNETDLQRLPRAHRVLETLLVRISEEPDLLDAVFEDGAPMIDGPDPAAVRFIFEALAASREAGRLEFRTLQVEPIGSDDQMSYRIVEDRVGTMVQERFADSVPATAGQGGRRLQVLNGNGIPGIGQQVAERLRPGGFRLVDTGNAASFDVPVTRIIVYRDDPTQLRAAQEVKDLLGVGEIEVSEVPVSVVDITIIVGADFP